MRIVITRASSRIGTALLRRLAADSSEHQIVGVCRPPPSSTSVNHFRTSNTSSASTWAVPVLSWRLLIRPRSALDQLARAAERHDGTGEPLAPCRAPRASGEAGAGTMRSDLSRRGPARTACSSSQRGWAATRHNVTMKLPVMPPVSPMLAKSVASIPPGAS